MRGKMKKILVLLFMGAVLASSTELLAHGLGAYVNISGKNNYLYGSNRATPNHALVYTNLVLGMGLTIDLNFGKNDLLSYRINIGYDNLINDNIYFKNYYHIMYFNRINLINSFGISLMKNDTIRIYSGPQVALRYQFGSGEDILIDKSFWYKKIQVNHFGLGVGLILGIDIKLNDRITFTPEIGFRYEFNMGKLNYKQTGIESYYAKIYGLYPNENHSIHGFEGGLNLIVICRVGENKSKIEPEHLE